MTIFCVYVDLNEPEQQLDKVSGYLDSFNAGIRAGERIWFIKTTKKAGEIRDEINKLPLSAGYHVLIFEVGEKWATQCARDEVNSWMGKHI